MPWDFAVILFFLAAVVPFLGKAPDAAPAGRRENNEARPPSIVCFHGGVAMAHSRNHSVARASSRNSPCAIRFGRSACPACDRRDRGSLRADSDQSIAQLAAIGARTPGGTARNDGRSWLRESFRRTTRSARRFSRSWLRWRFAKRLFIADSCRRSFGRWTGVGFVAILGVERTVRHRASLPRAAGMSVLRSWWDYVSRRYVGGPGALLPPVISHFVADIAVGILAPGRLQSQSAEATVIITTYIVYETISNCAHRERARDIWT